MADEIHIVSLVVHARPDMADLVGDAISRLPGTEIAAVTEDGRMAVTMEAANEGEIVDRMNTMHDVRGVLSVALVFQQVEALDEPQERIAT